MSDGKLSSNSPDAKDTHQLQLAPGTIRIELVQSSKWSVTFLALLLLCVIVFGVGWVAMERTTTRILHPESHLSVLELEESVIKFAGIDAHYDVLKAQYAERSDIGITFSGFTRLGPDLSKAKFDLDLLRSRLTIALPKAEVTEICVEDVQIWDRRTNPEDGKRLEELEVKLRNDALTDFRDIGQEKFYIDTANALAKVILRAYYKRNYPWLKVEFRRLP